MAKTKFGTLTREGKIINPMEIDLAKVKSSDPIAFAYGFFQGKSGHPISKDKGLAPEYVRGFKAGLSERKKLKKVM